MRNGDSCESVIGREKRVPFLEPGSNSSHNNNEYCPKTIPANGNSDYFFFCSLPDFSPIFPSSFPCCPAISFCSLCCREISAAGEEGVSFTHSLSTTTHFGLGELLNCLNLVKGKEVLDPFLPLSPSS